MNKELYVDEAVVIGEDIFFTATNECCLYNYNIITEKINKQKELSVTTANIKKFISMINYNNKIWMIPLYDNYFRIYDVVRKTIRCLEVPKQCIMNDGNALFRRVVHNEEYIWLIPNYSDCIIQINMEEEDYKIFNSWPKGVDVKKDKPNFKSASYFNGKLYMFRDNCSANIIIDVNDGSMQVWDLPIEGEFGLVKDGKVIVAPVKSGNTIRIFSLKESNSVYLDTEIILDEDVWAHERIYAFWYMDYIDDKVFILPHEANALLILDITTMNIKTVKLANYKHKNLYDNGLFAVEAALKLGENTVIISYVGNQLIVLDRNNDVKRTVSLLISSDLYGNELKSFISGQVMQNSERWKNEKTLAVSKERGSIGERVYSALMKEN